MRLLIFILLLVPYSYTQAPALEPGVSHELAKWRAARYSNVRYKLNLTLEKMSPVLKGTMEVRVVLRDTGSDRRGDAVIILDWRKIKGFEERSSISNVSINGKPVENHPVGEAPTPLLRKEGSQERPLAFSEHNEHLIFDDGVIAGENVIRLDFTSPILTSGSAITRYVDKEDGAEYIYSLFVPSDASTAFPVFDQPDLKARFTLSAFHPEGWDVVGNSRSEMFTQTSSSEEGTFFQHRFVETGPISTYVFAFAAGPFVRVDDEPPSSNKPRNVSPELKAAYKKWLSNVVSYPLSAEEAEKHRIQRNEELSRIVPSDSHEFSDIYVRKSQLAKFQPHAAEVFRLNREGIKHLETYFDYKFPFPKYDLVLIPEFPFGGMEHAGATFLREDRVIFPQEPTKNDYITRANLIFHEAAHQWFGDTVTMRWFDDLWLKEGFAEFMAYKTLEKVMPEYNAWKVFYERNKQAAYLTDSTRGTTPIYQEIANLSAAKSAYGNIVYRKAPSFLKQAEFYIGADKFQTAVRAFLKKHEFGNAGWKDLVTEFETAGGRDLGEWARVWVTTPGVPIIRPLIQQSGSQVGIAASQKTTTGQAGVWRMATRLWFVDRSGKSRTSLLRFEDPPDIAPGSVHADTGAPVRLSFAFLNYQDYGYGIFLLDDKSRDYVLKNIQNEKDEFLRSMMWGALWDSVREGELDPKEYVELVLRVLSPAATATPGKKLPEGATPNAGEDETTVATLLNRVSTAMTYYLSEKQRDAIAPRLEAMLIEKMQNAPTLGQRLTFYRAFLNIGSTEKARSLLKDILNLKFQISDLKLKTKDRFDIVTRLLILNDPDAQKLLADLEKTETSDEAKRYAYAARAGIPTKENKAKYWTDFTANKEISESWIEAAFGPFNSVRHADLTLPYLERSLKELPNHKRNRKIFFINGWLGAFIGGQRSEEALAIVNKFLADNPNLDRDLRLKILENVDLIERAVKIRAARGRN